MRAKEFLIEYHYDYGAWYDSKNQKEYEVQSSGGNGHLAWLRNNGYEGHYRDAYAAGLVRIVTNFNLISQSPALSLNASTDALKHSRQYIRKLLDIMQDHPLYMKNGGTVYFDIINNGELKKSETFKLPLEMDDLKGFIARGFQ